MSMRRSYFRAAGPLAIALSAGMTTPVMAQVQWRSPDAPAFAPSKGIPTALPRAASGGDGQHVAVQLSRAPNDADRVQLAAAGVRLCAPLGNNAFFATITGASFDPGAQAMIELVIGVQPIDPQWKLHPSFTAGDASAWTQVGTVDGQDGKPEPVVALYLVLHADVADVAAAAAIVQKHGGIVRSTIRSINSVVIELPLSAAMAVAGEDAVQWIEPALPMLTPNNAENRALTHANQVNAAPYNLDGSGVTAFVFDAGSARATHQDFGGRATVIDNASQQNHATHVSGTVGGNGSASGGANRGMAPGVTLLSAGLTASGEFLYTNPGDIEADYTTAIGLGAEVANNSIGTNTETNGFPCTWQGDYGVTDALIDAIVRGSPTVSGGEPFRVVWAAGNERQGNRCDVEGFGDYYSVAPPAGAKNHLCIGAVNANDDSMTSFSAWGPTDDGRLKPDFCAPGCQSGGDGGVTSCSSSSNTAYSVSCGTSMAAPTTTGLVALMIQDWKNLYAGDPLPRNSTVKSLLAQSAVDLGNAGPDYVFGYGSIRIEAAIDLMRSGAHTEGTLNQSFVHIYTITVAPSSGPLVVTTAWDDVAATPNVVPSLINDLDLRVLAPDGTRHYPWTLNPANPSAAAVRTQEDHLNNIEQVRVDSPAAGVWTIEVRATNVPEGPQTYSVVASSPSFAFSGAVSLDVAPITLAPGSVMPNVPTPTTVQVDIAGDTLVSGSVMLHYRADSGTFASIPMFDTGGGVYEAMLPGFACETTPEYYFSAEGDYLGVVSYPTAAASGALSILVGDLNSTFFDMESDAGWVSGAPGDNATNGLWERGVPESTTAQPGEDHTPAPGVNCWITGRLSGGGVGSFDVDGGTTTLLSPVFDLSTSSASTRIGYWRWYSNNAGAAPNADVFTVDISNDGGTNWESVEVVGPAGEQASGGWFYHEFSPADIASLTSSMRMRFVASDLGAGSIVEAAVDDLTITAVSCSDACQADFDQNGSVEVPDIFAFLSAWFAGDPSADIDGTAGIAVPDIFAFLSLWFAGC